MKITATSPVVASAGQSSAFGLFRQVKRLFCGLHVAVLLSLAALALSLLVPTGARAQDAYTLDNDSVSVSGSLWTITGTNINIGYSGYANLDITSTGTLAATGTAFIGRNAGSSGTATVSGLWNQNGPIYLGDAGAGALIIETTGTVLSKETSRVGFNSTGTGSAIVRGYWNNASTLVIGGTGKGSLEIASTGTLISGNFYAADYTGSEAVLTIAGYMATGQSVIGQRGTATVNVLAGGTMMTTATTQHILLGNTADGYGVVNVKDGGYVYAGYQIRAGVVAGGTGIFNIESGATVVANLGVYASLGNGYGVVNIANGGTLVINANALYVGNGGTANNMSYGEVNIDGYFQSGGGGSYYTPVGYAGMGVVRVGATGIVKSGQFDIAREWTSSGTVIIAGNVEIAASAGETYVGNAGKGVLIIQDGGYYSTGTYIRIGGNGQAGGPIAIGSGTYKRIGVEDTSGFIATSTVAGATNNGIGSGYLYVAPSGTLITKGVRFAYASPFSSAVADIDGFWQSTGDYIIVAHHGDSTLNIGVTGTVLSTGYISIGQGDSYTNTQFTSVTGRPLSDYATYVSGTVNVAGYLSGSSYLRVGNRTIGVLNLAESGTIIVKGDFRVSEPGNNYAGASGTANIAGYLEAGGNLTNGSNPGVGFLNIASTSKIIAVGGFTQNAASTLSVVLDPSREADTVNPDIPLPMINVGGAAILSGTLRVSGSALATIPEFQWDASGHARAGTLTGLPILRATGGITGDFDHIEFDGLTIPSTLPDFISGGGLKVNEGGPMDTRYDVGYGLAWKGGVAAAHGNFTVDAGKTFDLDVQLNDRPGMTFDTGWDGKSLVKKGQGTLTFLVQNAYTGTTTVESGTLRFSGPSTHTMGVLVNNGIIDFDSNSTNGMRTITASSLSGTGAYLMNVDLSTGSSDRLVINGDASGSHRLLITVTSNDMPKGDEPMPTLVTVGGVYRIEGAPEIAEVTTQGGTFYGSFDYGRFNYKIDLQNGRIVIVNTGLEAQVIDAIKGVPGAQSVLWFDHLDNVSRRFGELRTPRENDTGLDIWARGHAASATIGGGSTETRLSDVDIWGAEIGADYTWKLDDQRATVGAYIGTGNASQDFKLASNPIYGIAKATGESDLLGIGVYAAWFSHVGWFANVTASLAQYKNSFDSEDFSRNHTIADYKDRGYGVTAEFGRRFAIGEKGWFLEPAVQGSIARLTRADYDAVRRGDPKLPLLSIHGSDLTVTRLRGALRVGRGWQTRAGWLELTGRVAATRERSSGGEVNIGSADRWRPNLDGTRYEAGASAFWQAFESGQLYFDYEYSAGDNYEKPWAVSFGFRLSL